MSAEHRRKYKLKVENVTKDVKSVRNEEFRESRSSISEDNVTEFNDKKLTQTLNEILLNGIQIYERRTSGYLKNINIIHALNYL